MLCDPRWTAVPSLSLFPCFFFHFSLLQRLHLCKPSSLTIFLKEQERKKHQEGQNSLHWRISVCSFKRNWKKSRYECHQIQCKGRDENYLSVLSVFSCFKMQTASGVMRWEGCLKSSMITSAAQGPYWYQQDFPTLDRRNGSEANCVCRQKLLLGTQALSIPYSTTTLQPRSSVTPLKLARLLNSKVITEKNWDVPWRRTPASLYAKLVLRSPIPIFLHWSTTEVESASTLNRVTLQYL